MSRFLILLLCITTQACIFSPATEKPAHQMGQFQGLNEQTPIRRQSLHSCVCGEDFHPDKIPGNPDNDTITAINNERSHRNQKWILYIRLAVSKARTRLCVGTIVNSNMVITSHRCLKKKESISVADIFRSKLGNASSLASPSDITLSSEMDLSSPTNQLFQVKKIIYSERFAYDHIYDPVPESDVAILVVDFDFTKSQTKNSSSPICMAKYGKISTKQIINMEGHYQGIRSWGGVETYYNLGVHSYSRIGTAEDCNEVGKLGVKPKNNETLCLVFTFPGPTIEGGPLGFVVKRFIEGGPRRSFLLGLANWVEKEPTNGTYNYAYFENINSIVKYIEHQSTLHGSTWCPTPNPDDQNWPWESLTAPYVFDKSLDCECGRQDLPAAKGRIIGGNYTGDGEFPWMAKLIITINYINNKSETVSGSQLCGGSIINDRMILTAAHCFVFNEKLFLTDSYNLDYNPNQVEVTEIFVRSLWFSAENDENNNISYVNVYAKKILFHPGYVDESREFRQDFDIALIILNDSLTLGKETKEHGRIDPICLPKKNYVSSIIGHTVTAAGWGIPNYNSINPSPILKKVDVIVWFPTDCFYQDWTAFNITTHFPTDTRFCANSVESYTENAGEGDSGGPLMHRMKNGKYTQVGLVSYYNVNETQAVTTTYYTSVEAFLPYIYYYSNEYGARFCNPERRAKSAR